MALRITANRRADKESSEGSMEFERLDSTTLEIVEKVGTMISGKSVDMYKPARW